MDEYFHIFIIPIASDRPKAVTCDLMIGEYGLIAVFFYVFDQQKFLNSNFNLKSVRIFDS
eukprot:TRINITY_DN3298_c4_g2_i3.p2 TRINITY_DN3298_c4_g2~~TRINITY_DN3298_c4_g2_i3.p2  ORF type:complete len:60 (+),score=16.78 TRINITY_DN3298_c4_g2_i3:412-591(+)